MSALVQGAAFGFGALLLTTAAAAVEVKLQVRETEGSGRAPAVITSGVPFSRGALKDVSKLSVSTGGKKIPAQFAKLVPWDDGSVRWALMDVQADVPAGGAVELTVSDIGAQPAPVQPVKVEDGTDAVRVSTGPLRFAISRRRATLCEALTLDGKEIVTAGGRGLVLRKEDGGEVVAAPPDEVKIEQAGPLRAVVCIRGSFPGVHDGLLRYTARIAAFAGRRHIKVQLWIENHGAMGYFTPRDFNQREAEGPPSFGWFAFAGLDVELGLGMGPEITALCEGAEAADRLKVLQLCRHSKTKKRDQSTGPFYTWEDFEYLVTSGETELKRGLRTDGVVALKGAAGALTVAVRDFWQNYEKAIELDGGKLRIALWPAEGEWPRPYYWLRYGIDRRILAALKPGSYLLAGGVHKGHEFIMDLSGSDPRQAAAELSAPLAALASAEYYAATEAAPGMFAPPGVRTGERECDGKLDAWMMMTRGAVAPASPGSLWKAREVSDYSGAGGTPDSSHWFGWMDYGDLCVPGHGPVALHYDWTRIMLLNALRTGDGAFLRLGSAMARHRIDIDQLWSDRDLPEYRGLQRGGGAWPGYHCSALHRPPSPADNWLAGTVLYYMLTGEPKALESCARNAEGLKKAWAWVAQARPYWNPQGNVAANAQAMESYAAMYALTGKRDWLEEALALFRSHIVPKWKELGPFLHDADNQIRSQSYVKEDMNYCYSIATLCELHHLTGDTQLLELLQAGCDEEFPESFFDAPLFLSDLYAYVGLKTGNRALLEKAAESFARAFPESKCPPVFLPDSSTWSRTSAMMLRTGHILQYANWKMGMAQPPP